MMTPVRGTKLLEAENIRRYEQDGVIFRCRLSLRPTSRLSRTDSTTWNCAAAARKYTAFPRVFPWVWKLTTMPRLLDAAEDLIGPELVIESTLLLCKYPRDLAVPWHQDGVYSGWYKTPSVTAWIASSMPRRRMAA
jgi:hypothetical protein